MAQPSPRPRFGPRPTTAEETDSAVREFDFAGEAPTRAVTLPELDLQFIAESGEYPVGWSKNPTIPSPPTRDDLALCAEHPTPILPIDDHSSAPAFLPKTFPQVALRDPGPPPGGFLPLSLSERPTAPPMRTPALSQRPTAVPPRVHLSPPYFPGFSQPEEAPAWPEEGGSRQTKRSVERDAVRPSRPSDPFRAYSAPPSTQGAIPLRKVSPPPSSLHAQRRIEKPAPVSPRAATEIQGPRAAVDSVRTPARRIHTGKIRVLMTPERIRALPLDHKAGFLLSMLGTVSTLDELLDISGMPRNDAMRLLCDLADLGAIDLG